MLETGMRETAIETIGAVMQNGAFILVDEAGQKPTHDAGKLCRGVRVDFSGRHRGSVHLWVDDAFGRYAAANMLGIDEDSPQAVEARDDAVRELLNMTVGNLLTALYGHTETFTLSVPETLPSERYFEDADSDSNIIIDAEGSILMFHFEGDVAAGHGSGFRE